MTDSGAHAWTVKRLHGQPEFAALPAQNRWAA
jgi:hypothetical protein